MKGEIKMEIQIEKENGTVEKHEVSKDFMDLCSQQAKFIVGNDDEYPKTEDILTQVRECTSNDVQRIVIMDMVVQLLAMKAEKLLVQRFIEETLMGD